jgi:hypothetical protein
MKEMGKCAVCGKPVIIRSVHDTRKGLPNYCSRVCATNSKYASGRYKEAPVWERLTAQELLERKLT